MTQDQEVVIVGADGKEHVFPSGFDPKRAASIVKQQAGAETRGHDEGAFRSWYAQKAKQYDLNPDPDSPGQFYDYRAAFKANAAPDETNHWPSQFKKPGHPNEIVGGFNTRTGERVAGTPRASESELVRMGWDAETAKRLAAMPERQPGLATIGDQLEAKGRNPLVDVGVGALKGVGNTVFGLGKLVHDYTPVGRISDAILPGAFDEKPPEIVPNNTAQRVGYTGEQVGEFMLPLSALSKAGRVAQGVRAAAQTMMQTGSPVESGVSAAITAAIPGGSAAKRAASALDRSAQKSVTQALGATKEWAKAESAKLAPQMIERGVKGSRPAMLAEAKAAASTVGKDLDAAYAAAAAGGDTISGQIVRGSLELTRDALKVKDAAGKLVTIPGTERVISKLDQLHDFVTALGDDIPVDKAAHVKRVMDKIVDKAGLFGAKATSSATDNADAWAVREASGSFRELLNRNPTIADLNKELGFWSGLKKVLKETEKRTQAQRGGITDAIRGGGGAVAGAAMGAMTGGPLGGGIGAVLGQQVMQQVSKALESPQFKTTAAAPIKAALADALASGSTGKVLDALRKFGASAPSQVEALAK